MQNTSELVQDSGEEEVAKKKVKISWKTGLEKYKLQKGKDKTKDRRWKYVLVSGFGFHGKKKDQEIPVVKVEVSQKFQGDPRKFGEELKKNFRNKKEVERIWKKFEKEKKLVWFKSGEEGSREAKELEIVFRRADVVYAFFGLEGTREEDQGWRYRIPPNGEWKLL